MDDETSDAFTIKVCALSTLRLLLCFHLRIVCPNLCFFDVLQSLEKEFKRPEGGDIPDPVRVDKPIRQLTKGKAK